MLKAFDTVKPTAETIQKMNVVRLGYSKLAEMLQEMMPASRERSVALTELETSAMWAIKALTHNQPPETPPAAGTPGGQ